MASVIHVLVAVITMVAAAVAPVLAKDYVVGDDKGWIINFDYQAWADSKKFYVGDKLVFKYPQGVHNVQKVDGTSFKNCTKPADSLGLTTGNDEITLATTGKKGYICGVGSHYASGNQKLAITVLEKEGSTSSSPPTSTNPTAYIALVAAMAVLTLWWFDTACSMLGDG